MPRLSTSPRPSAVRRFELRRQRRVVEMAGSGANIEEISACLSLTRQNVRRILRAAAIVEKHTEERKHDERT